MSYLDNLETVRKKDLLLPDESKGYLHDVYGTTEFWNDILILNNCTSIREFDPKPDKEITFYDPEYMKAILNEIMIIEDML